MVRIITLNVNGLRSSIQKGLFPWLLTQDPDLICLQEIKISEDYHTHDLLKLSGYQSYFFSAEKKGYSGVAIYAKALPIEVIYGLNWHEADCEGRYLQLNYPEFSVASLYLPSGTSGEHRQAFKYVFLDKFGAHLKQILKQDKPCIFCGDFNIAHKPIDLKNWRSNQKNSGFLPDERAWLDYIIDELGYVDAFRAINQEADHYTWWSYRRQSWDKNVGWRIDYQLLTPNLKGAVQSALIHRSLRVSDHAPLMVDYQLS